MKRRDPTAGFTKSPSESDEKISNGMPKYLEKFKRDWDAFENRIKLPLVRQLSARTKRRISELPPPSDNEVKKTEKIYNNIVNMSGDKAYERLVNISNANRAKSYKKEAEPLLTDIYEESESFSSESLFFKRKDLFGSDIYTVANDSTQYFEKLARKRIKENLRKEHFNRSLELSKAKSKPNVDGNSVYSGIVFDKPLLLPDPSNNRSLPPIQFKSELADYINRKSSVNNSSVFSSSVLASASHTIGASKSTPHLLTVHTSGARKSRSAQATTDSGSLEGTQDFTGSVTELMSPIESASNHMNSNLNEFFQFESKEGELGEEYHSVLEETKESGDDVIMDYLHTREDAAKELEELRRREEERERFLNKWKSKLLDHHGVDVDAEYNERRLLGKAIDYLFYHLHTHRLKDAIDKLKQHVVQSNRDRRLRSVGLLVRVSRGFIARKHVRAIRINIAIQREARRKEMEARRALEHRSALRILFCYKSMLLRRYIATAIERRRAATCIQRVYRGRLGRLLAVRQAEWRRTLGRSAVKLQTLLRMLLAKRQVRLMRKINAVRIREEMLQKRKKELRERFRMRGAAIVLAYAYRTRNIKGRLKALLFWSEVLAAMHFQRVFRGHRARKEAHKIRAEKLKVQQMYAHHVTVIQSFFRSCIARAELLRLYAAKQERIKQRRIQKEIRQRDKTMALGGTTVNVSEWKRWFRETGRHYTPFRHVIGKGEIMLDEKVYDEKKKRIDSTLLLQRFWRGHRVRWRARHKRRMKMALRIQCWWRIAYSHLQLQRRKVHAAATNILSRFIIGIIVYRRYLRSDRDYLLNMTSVRKVQRACRRHLSKARRRSLRDKLRVEAESSASATLAAKRALCSVQIMLLAESLERALGRKPSSRCGWDCMCYGPVQSIFVQATGKKANYDLGSLITNKLDGRSFLKLLERVDGLFNDESKSASSSAVYNTSGSVGSAPKTIVTFASNANYQQQQHVILEYDNNRLMNRSKAHLTLLDALRLRLFSLPKIVKKIKPTDADLIFNRLKSSGSSTLSYFEFCAALQMIGEIAFDGNRFGNHFAAEKHQVLENIPGTVADNETASVHSQSHKDDDDRWSEITGSLTFDEEDSSAVLSRPTPSKEASLSSKGGGHSRRFRSLSPSKPSSTVTTKSVLSSLLLSISKRMKLRGRVFFPPELLANELGTLALSLTILILKSAEDKDWVRPVTEWLEAESRARVGHFATRIQRLVRSFQAKTWVNSLRIQRKLMRENKRKEDAAIVCQAVIRGYLGRISVVRRAQNMIKKYVPATGPPYWYLASTNMTTWQRPKILGKYDCLSIPMPEKGLEYVVTCCMCDKPASVNCLNCEDSMCQICFSSLHCKGNRKFHVPRKIPVCTLCTYQMATKSCSTCALRKQKKNAIERVLKKDFAVLCDCCFNHRHSNLPERTEANWARLDAAKGLEVSKEAFIVKLAIHQKLLTDHSYDSLVQPCEECSWRGAAWRCLDCDQVYCNKCLIGLHSIGGPFAKHKAESLPYYSKELHKRYESGAWARRMHERVLEVTQLYARAQLEARVRSSIRLQAWWRKVMGRKRGRAYMKQRRLEMRAAFRLRHLENVEIRSKFAYRIRHVFGMAPVLKSDTKEEIVLKKITLLGRLRAREYIWQNKDDWGFYRVSRTNPRKGIPHTGFEVGTVEELVSQAKYGGFRLPGYITMKKGSAKHETLTDLSLIVFSGQFIRVHKYIFGVISVEDNIITFDRKWRGEDMKQEVAYRLPNLKDEKKRRYYKLKHEAFNYMTKNFITQNYLKLHVHLSQKLANTSNYFSRSFKNRGFMKTAYKFGNLTKAFESSGMWAKSLLEEQSNTVKLPDLTTTTKEDVMRALRKEREQKKAAGKKEAFVSVNDELKRKRIEKEDNMTVPELLKEAEKWDQRVDPRTNQVFYIHFDTREVTFDVPAAVEQRNYKEAENMRKRASYEETQKKIAKLSKKQSRGARKR